jgi:hypothetical protein
MGSGISSTGNETEQKVYNTLRGVVLRKGKVSPLQQFLSVSLPHQFYSDPKAKFQSLYVVKDGKEMERYGLLPSFQGGPDRFIVRPLRKEYIEGNKHFRKADSKVQDGVTAIYSVLGTIIATTGMALASHTKDHKDLVDEVMRNSESKTKDTKSTQNYPDILIGALRTYSSQKHTRNVNSPERNILFHISNYPTIVPTMLKRIEDRIGKKHSSDTIVGKGDILLHTGVLKAVDSFSICSTSPNSLKVMLNHLRKTGYLDAIVSTIHNLLEYPYVRTWLDNHPALKNKLQSITAGTIRSARLIAKSDTNLNEVIQEILGSMREQVEDSCKNNEALSSYSTKKNVLVKSSGSDKYEYSREANRMIVRIYQRFESITRKMQSDILGGFMSIFDISKEENPNTINIQSGEEYLHVKMSVISAREPSVMIMNTFMNILEAYMKYIINLQNVLKATINRSTRILS